MNDDLNDEQAQFFQESLIKQGISQARKHDPNLSYTGRCHNCQDPVPHQHRFCDLDCMHDWEKRKRADRQRGS